MNYKQRVAQILNNNEFLRGFVMMEYDLAPMENGRKAKVYINPPTKQIRKIIQSIKEVGGIIEATKPNDLYLWNRDELDHDAIIHNYMLTTQPTRSNKNPIPFYIIDNTITLSPSSYLGVDPEKDIKKIQRKSPALKELSTDITYFQGKL